jgi:hypothetical protein
MISVRNISTVRIVRNTSIVRTISVRNISTVRTISVSNISTVRTISVSNISTVNIREHQMTVPIISGGRGPKTFAKATEEEVKRRKEIKEGNEESEVR